MALRKYNLDIVFLDVEMPEENGFSLFDYIREPGFEMIFTTAYKKVALPTFTGYKMETINHIIYCQADVNYTRIFTRHDNSILVSKTLKFIEELLPSDCFFRIHKTYLVNMNYITQYIKTGGHRVELENGQILEVAQRRAEEFEQVLTGKKC